MEIKRDKYLEKIISYMWDGQVKVITGIRRSGKSYLLGTLFRKYLLETEQSRIISFPTHLTLRAIYGTEIRWSLLKTSVKE